MANKRWATDSDGKHVLYFTPYYDEELIATLFRDDSGDWCYSSALLGDESEYLGLGNNAIEEAKEQIEQFVYCHYDAKLAYYEDLKRKFEEE